MVKYEDLKDMYEDDYYYIYPKEGKVISKVSGAEIAKDNSKIVVVRDNSSLRARIKKMRFIYEAVNGKLPHGAIIEAFDGDERNAKYDNIKVIEDRTSYFKGHDWSSLHRFDEATVEEIRRRYEEGDISYDELAKDYHCGLSTIQKIMQKNYVYDRKDK